MPCQVTETLAWTFLKSIFPDRLISQALLQPWIVSSHGSQIEVNNFERHPSLHDILLQFFAPSGSKLHADVPFSSHRLQNCFMNAKRPSVSQKEGPPFQRKPSTGPCPHANHSAKSRDWKKKTKEPNKSYQPTWANTQIPHLNLKHGNFPK